MKKVLLIAAAGLILAACASKSNVNTSGSSAAANIAVPDTSSPSFTDVQYDANSKPAPSYNYESNASYEDQLRATGTYIRGIRGKDAQAPAAAQQ